LVEIRILGGEERGQRSERCEDKAAGQAKAGYWGHGQDGEQLGGRAMGRLCKNSGITGRKSAAR
jgi:hypothetical protein